MKGDPLKIENIALFVLIVTCYYNAHIRFKAVTSGFEGENKKYIGDIRVLLMNTVLIRGFILFLLLFPLKIFELRFYKMSYGILLMVLVVYWFFAINKMCLEFGKRKVNGQGIHKLVLAYRFYYLAVCIFIAGVAFGVLQDKLP